MSWLGFLNIFTSLMGLVQEAEVAVKEPGAGAQKKEMVVGSAAPLVQSLSDANVIKESDAAALTKALPALVDAAHAFLSLIGELGGAAKEEK